ncbi:TadE/TadG family type IV pilus assembly protein [Enteractinococcus coprophilus]|uniref:TadE-like protein n=1 Tax=Enteractinococcus coprophilus TaxID=1027633 RepID=A0A542ZZW5_9MICC|nr:TadE/TadG family type IV pilus assembly protein [Enteractinococcus coprophilus]TQL65883.1 TadE-like protein [Enteractinococcus coprophilus]
MFQGLKPTSRRDTGAVVAESAMIIGLVTLLCGTILQIGVIIHTRNTMIDAASAGARYAALADRNLTDGQKRTAALLASSIPNAESAIVTIGRESDGELIRVTVTHHLPMLGFITAPVPLSATAQAYDLTP